MSQLIRRTNSKSINTNPQQQKQRNLETMSQWNIITNNKYQWQQQQVVPTNNNTKVEMSAGKATAFHEQRLKHQEPARKQHQN